MSKLAELQKTLREKYEYEGLELESVVQGWFYLDEYQQGIQAHRSIKTPSPQDDRWLGACYTMTRQRMEALEVLYRAVAKGEEAARIQVARVLGFLERGQEATAELERIDVDKLKPADKVLYYRAQSIQQDNTGSVQQALNYAEEAWRHTQGIPEFPLLAPWVLARMGRLYGLIGRAQRALWCFDRALEITGKNAPYYLQFSRITAMVSLGQYVDVIAETEALKKSSIPTDFEATRLYLRADAAWATGDIRGALNWYGQAVEKAVEAQSSNAELLSRLALTALLGSKGAYEAASEHLARAQFLLSDKYDRLYHRFRELLLLRWQGNYNDEQTCNELEMLVADFGAMGSLQEQGWVRLHLAEIYRNMGDSRYLKELDKLQSLSVALQNKAFLAREWTLVPHLREAALMSHPKLAGKAAVVLEVHTLGEEKLVLGGTVISIRLRRAIELLAYFLEHKEISLKRLQSEIFPDEKPRSAKSYFHQFRHELHERIPELEIVYDADGRVYRLESDIDILWDVAELRAGRKMGDTGIFLPGSGNEWAQLLDQELEPAREARPLPIAIEIE